MFSQILRQPWTKNQNYQEDLKTRDPKLENVFFYSSRFADFLRNYSLTKITGIFLRKELAADSRFEKGEMKRRKLQSNKHNKLTNYVPIGVIVWFYYSRAVKTASWSVRSREKIKRKKENVEE